MIREKGRLKFLYPSYTETGPFRGLGREFFYLAVSR